VAHVRIGVIGGSGVGQAFSEQSEGETVQVQTPFGAPSAPVLLTKCENIDVAFISRHGPGHLLNPTGVPYRANIYALKKLGVTHILSTGATGSLREDIEPGHLVICDQVIDKTHRRENTFFDDGCAVHVEFAEPFCGKLRDLLIDLADKVETKVHPKGTYVAMEGPAFSTRAESMMHRAWGGDLIGMTAMPEARLAREAEISYALIALPTDYDCWRPHEEGRDQMALLEEIIGNLNRATANAIALLHQALPALHERLDEPWPSQDALKLAIWSDKSKVSPDVVRRLGPLVQKYF